MNLEASLASAACSFTKDMETIQFSAAVMSLLAYSW